MNSKFSTICVDIRIVVIFDILQWKFEQIYIVYKNIPILFL